MRQTLQCSEGSDLSSQLVAHNIHFCLTRQTGGKGQGAGPLLHPGVFTSSQTHRTQDSTPQGSKWNKGTPHPKIKHASRGAVEIVLLKTRGCGGRGGPGGLLREEDEGCQANPTSPAVGQASFSECAQDMNTTALPPWNHWALGAINGPTGSSSPRDL